MDQTVGEFLKEKMTNMAQWVTANVGKDNLDIDLVQYAMDRTELEVTYLAQLLRDNHTHITHKNWKGVADSFDEFTGPNKDAFLVLLQAVRQRDDMHDKFWRYLELFRDIVNSDPTESDVREQQGSIGAGRT